MRLHYVSYEVATGVTRLITQAIRGPINRTAEEGARPDGQKTGRGIAGWFVGDQALLLYDQYDLWQVDPRALLPPVNLTAGYGRQHKIVFRIEETNGTNMRLRTNDIVLLKGLDDETKDQGYWTTRVGQSAAPTLGSLEPWVMGASIFGGYFSSRPIKAIDASVYLVPRQNERDPPNWYVTTDLKSYRRLTNLQPQQGYNWLTSELRTWTLPDGKRSQGILYKPENFDPAKKYPVIFYYYEQLSRDLHLYRKYALSSGQLNIPRYVSNGYLVFVPDIPLYVTGRPARSVVDAVVSAADYLATFPWVDTTKMGLQGHSFGGYETLVLVTHSHRFAAANAASGLSDLVSRYGTPGPLGRDDTWRIEDQQGRMGTTPWQRPDLYVENSPLFQADSVTTPLLLMANKGDDTVPFAQSLEMFIALRRLQKPVWLLQYDGEGHTIARANEQRDFSIRQAQFFDHYLKGAPAPIWMTQGIPAKVKGVVSGLEYDPAGRTP